MGIVLIILGFAGLVLMGVFVSLKHIASPVQLGLESRLPYERESLADHINEPQQERVR